MNLRSTVFLLLSLCIYSTHAKTIFKDDFNDNSQNWSEKKDDVISCNVKNGTYQLEHKSSSGAHLFFRELELLNGDDDFEIEVKLRQVSGVENHGYGFVFGMEDVRNYHGFIISSNRQYSVYAFNNNDYIEWKEWSDNSMIKPLGEYNTLNLQKRKGRYLFSINGSLVCSTVPKTFLGNKIGFVLNNQMAVEVDYIRVDQTELSLSKLSKGEDISNAEIMLEEDFSDNGLKWDTKKNETAEAEINKGVYEIKYNASSGSYYYWTPHEIPFNNDEDFYAELKIKLVSGPDNKSFGLAFAAKDANNSFNFTICNLGQFTVFARDNGHYQMLKGWTKSSAIKKKLDTYNVLGLRKKGQELHFYINGKEVYKTYYRKRFGEYFGIVLSNSMRVKIDEFIIYRTKRTLNLVADASSGSQKKNLGTKINSKYNELGPLVSPDGKTLYFFRNNHPENLGVDNKGDIWVSHLDKNNQWGKAYNIGKPLNNIGHNYVVSVPPDNNVLVLGKEYLPNGLEGLGGLSISKKEKKGWSMPEKIKIYNEYNLNKFYNYYLTSDRKTLISSVERADSEGKLDLYVSFLQHDNTWTEPESLGPTINTSGMEITPYVATDGKTLYFSSNGFAGYGDNDIFVSRRLDDSWKKWSVPKNLGPEINTPRWDAYYSIPASGDVAYLASYDNTIGESDIFVINLPESAKPEPVLLVRGKVIDNQTKEGIGTSISVRDLKTDKEVAIATSNPADGSYEIVLPKGVEYAFYAKEEGYYAVRENVDLNILKEYGESEVDLYLTPIVKGQNIRLNNVFFVRGKAEIKSSSFAELDHLVEVLKNNPSLEIEIEGHTDNTGSAKLNVELSEERVESVINYLVKRGVGKKRLSGKGYGGSKPIADNRYENTRKLNRRVEFKIVNY